MAGVNADQSKQDDTLLKWVYHRPRRLTNFSMEATFCTLHGSSKGGPPAECTVSEFSRCILTLSSVWRELKSLNADIQFIFGDINFACNVQQRRNPMGVLTIDDLEMLDEWPCIMRVLKAWFQLFWPSRSCDAIIVKPGTTNQDILFRCSCPEHQIHMAKEKTNTHRFNPKQAVAAHQAMYVAI